MKKKFNKSNKLLKLVEKNIPLGSQTFSKSKLFLPHKKTPLFLDRGSGCYVYDVDGNKYIDLISGLLSVSIGYNIKEINKKIQKQIEKGITLSLPTLLENNLAKKIIYEVPSAEMVRFAKNGSDVTSAAIRLSRMITNRKIILTCGYHGWHEWYIGKTTMNAGIPREMFNNTKTFKFNDIDSFKKVFMKNKNNIAAVILEPMNIEWPNINFLKKIRAMCSKNNTILIFDEICTGFRFSLGGAQKLFGITPDLTTLGKGMGNGFPISALAGKRKIMKHCSKIFFSSTFGGETLSLVAAISVIDYIKKYDVIKQINKLGDKIIIEINNHLIHSKIDFIKIKGHPSWSFFIFKDYKKYSKETLKTFFLEKSIEKGILTFGTNNLNYSHKSKDVNEIINIYKTILSDIKNKVSSNKKLIKYKEIKNLFQVRK